MNELLITLFRLFAFLAISVGVTFSLCMTLAIPFVVIDWVNDRKAFWPSEEDEFDDVEEKYIW